MGDQKIFCENCGQSLAVDAKFCEGCGQQVSTRPTPGPFPPPSEATPAGTLPPQVTSDQGATRGQKRFLPWIISVVVLVAIAGVAGGYFWGKSGDNRSPQPSIASSVPAMPKTEPPPQQVAETPSVPRPPEALEDRETGFEALPPPPPLEQKIESTRLPLPPPVSSPDMSASTGVSPRWPWTSQRPVTSEDLSQLTPWELVLMRNEIYARHGWVFHRPDLRAHFEQQPWYRPKGTLDNREAANRLANAELTLLERQNIKAILQYEKGHTGLR